MSGQTENIKARITEKAREIGFDTVAFAPVTVPDRNKDRFRDFLAGQEYGEMDWMESRAQWRESPHALWEEVRSVIVLGTNYGPARDPMHKLNLRDRANISVYAQNKDYHDLVKKRLKRLARWLVEESGVQVKVFVDTAPVLEKAVAAQSRLGWQGKHTNIVSNEYGSWLFLGEVFTTLEVEPDPVHRDQCGSCTACQDICPTKAFPAPYKLDARRCISYLTIEHKGHIPEEFRKPIGNRVYGCDDCLAVCPWNKFARKARDADFWPRAELTAPRLADFLDLDDVGFRSLFTGSPIKRVGRDRFLRNILIGLGNCGDDRFAPRIEPMLRDESPLVRAMAVWALRQLLTDDAFNAHRTRYLPQEKDVDVQQEWSANQ